MKKIVEIIRKGFIKLSSALTLMSLLSLTAFAEGAAATPPTNVDTATYNTLVTLVFWAVRILVLATTVIPAIIKIAQGAGNEDVRERNGGIALLIIGGVLFGLTFGIEALF